jgi:hypothetical protein
MLSDLFDRPGGRGSESDDDALDTGPSVANPPATVAGYDDTLVSSKPTSQKGGGKIKRRKLRVGDPVRVASSTLRKQNAKLRDGVGKSLVGKIERCGAAAKTWVTSFADIPGREFELRSNAVRRVHHPGPCGSVAETNWTEVELGTLANLGHQWAGVASQMPWTRIAEQRTPPAGRSGGVSPLALYTPSPSVTLGRLGR